MGILIRYSIVGSTLLLIAQQRNKRETSSVISSGRMSEILGEYEAFKNVFISVTKSPIRIPTEHWCSSIRLPVFTQILSYSLMRLAGHYEFAYRLTDEDSSENCPVVKGCQISCMATSGSHDPTGQQHKTVKVPLSVLLAKLQQSVVQIYASPTQCLADASFIGSGFISSSKGIIVTAGHLFEPKDNSCCYYFVRLFDGRWYRCFLVGWTSEMDVGVLRLTSKNDQLHLSTVDIASATVCEQGDKVIAYGSTQYGDEPVSVFGRVCQARQSFSTLSLNLKTRLIQLAMIAMPGFSGSPVFD